MEDALGFFAILIPVLWIALAIAIVIFVTAALARIAGPVAAWLEPRLGPRIARWSRARHGLAADAPPWACGACHSVNQPVALACYRCGAPAPTAAEALPAAPGDTWRPPESPNRFDPSLYRGPGAPDRPAEPDQPVEPDGPDGPLVD